jgi:hypothetical protein
MEYETIGGQLKNTQHNYTTLDHLQIGDVFCLKNAVGTNAHKWLVLGDREFNSGHGSPTRLCKDLRTGERKQRSCRLEVFKK